MSDLALEKSKKEKILQVMYTNKITLDPTYANIPAGSSITNTSYIDTGVSANGLFMIAQKYYGEPTDDEPWRGATSPALQEWGGANDVIAYYHDQIYSEIVNGQIRVTYTHKIYAGMYIGTNTGVFSLLRMRP